MKVPKKCARTRKLPPWVGSRTPNGGILAPQRGEDVKLGDPNVYSTFGHLRRALDRFHPAVAVEVVPGVSTVTAFTSAFDVEITVGSELTLREAADGDAPAGPDRMVLFKVTDVPTTPSETRQRRLRRRLRSSAVHV